SAGPLGRHLRRRPDREHLCRRARGDVPGERVFRLLSRAGAPALGSEKRRLHREHRRSARRARPFALRGLQRRGAVDDDVHRRGAGAPRPRQPGLARLGAHADGGAVLATHRASAPSHPAESARGGCGRRRQRSALAGERRFLALHRAGPVHFRRGAAGGAARTDEACVRLSGRELRLRAAEARRHYASCDLCAHLCGVDRRHGPAGVCQEDDGLSLAGAGVHYGEEPELVPSGVVLIAGCNLACQTCETWSFSLERRDAVRASPAQLAAILLDLQKAGAANANFVTPTHVLPVLLEGLAIAAEHGFSLPVVWNCGGYESVEALRLLEGVVDVYLPDAKYGEDAVAYELSGCRGYTAALEASLREMHRQAAEVIVR